MNKLAVLALALLLCLSSALWYLANGSLNEYLKSQVELQSNYYSGQKTTLALADFSPKTRIATLKQFNLANLNNHKAPHALVIDEVQVELPITTEQPLFTSINKITIKHLILNIEKQSGSSTNIEQLIQHVNMQLALDYPQLYPAIGAKIYAKKNPDLNAETYANIHPQAGPIIEHTQPKKKRGKPQQKIMASAININTLTINTFENNVVSSIEKYNIEVTIMSKPKGLVINQIGGEVLLHLLSLAN